MTHLLVRFEGADDPRLAPLLWELGGDQLSAPDGPAPDELHLAGGWLLVGGQDARLRPDSPWELGELRSFGLEVLDPRRSGSRDGLEWLSSWIGEGHVAVLGVAGRLDASTWIELTARTPGKQAPVACDDLLEAVRRPRTPREIRRIEEVAAVSDRAFLEVARRLAGAVADDGGLLWLGGEPLTVGTLRRAVDGLFAAAGVRQPEGSLIATGPRAADPHHSGLDSRRLRADEPVIVDLFPHRGLYSDCTRSFCLDPTGARSEGWLRGARDVLRALETAERALAEALRSVDRACAHQIHRGVCAELSKGGWPTQLDEDGACRDEGFVHGLGHGVGHELHEAPWFHQEVRGTSEGTITVGDVLTLEPGLYSPGAWGVRFEDLYVVEGGSGGGASLRRLTRAPRTWDPAEMLAGGDQRSTQ